ncbi:MAG: response regulator, partial [Deltaproteobacteria bacterium]|nr:response regulator [Deltaproteobacteria bacterium]
SKKILAVDDDGVLREMYSDILTDYGYSVVTAVDGMDALKRLPDDTFDLVITDINMPGLDGIGFYLATIRRHAYLKDRFLFVTGDPAAEREAVGVISEMKKTCLTKPFKLTEFLEHVRRLTALPLEERVVSRGVRVRGEQRVKTAAACYLFSGGLERSPIVSRAQDLSAGGIRVEYIGDPFDAGAEVNLNIVSMDLMRRALVVWAREAGKIVTAGLKFTEPLPSSVVHA